MAESSEETSRTGSPPPFDPAGSPPSGMPSQGSCPVQLRCKTLNLSNCHACGRDPAPLSLQALQSLWRLVLLCPNCLLSVHASKVCSYCFDQISSDGGGVVETVSCLSCSRLVHRRCVAASHLGSFNCVDCWMPRTASKKVSSSFRVLVLGNSCGSLEDVVKDAKLSARKAAMAAEKAKKKALRKAFVAKCAAEAAQKALDMAKVVGSGEKGANGSDSCAPVVGDKALALRLHRAINSSPRIFKRSRLASPERSEDYEGSEESEESDGSEESEESKGSKESEETEGSEESESEESESEGSEEEEGSEDSNCKDDELGILGPATCSSKVSKSCEGDNSLDSVSASNLKRADSDTKISSDCRGSHSVAGDDCDSSSLRKEVRKDERFLKKYARRKISSVQDGVDGDSTSRRVYARKCLKKSMTEEATSESADSTIFFSSFQKAGAKVERTFSGGFNACSSGDSGQKF